MADKVELLPDVSEVTPASMRSVLSQFATGVVLLTVGGEHVHGMTANAFSSVSLEPPTVLCSIAHSAVMYNAITAERRFGVSIMGVPQQNLATFFADKKRPLGPTQFDGIEYELGPATGVPLLSGALAWLECDVVDSLVSGDHTIFIGAVRGLSRGADESPLLFFNGNYGVRR